MKKTLSLTVESGVTYANVGDLFLYKDNPKDVASEDFARLDAQLELGEHSPLLVTVEGEVLGGNTRLRKYKEVGKKKAKVTVVDIVESKDGVRIVIDGEKSKRTFDSVDQAKIELALSHNDAVGTYNQEKLVELMTVNNVQSTIYNVPTKIVPVQDIIEKHNAGPPEDEEQGEEEEAPALADNEILCPNCNEVINLKSRGIKVERE